MLWSHTKEYRVERNCMCAVNVVNVSFIINKSKYATESTNARSTLILCSLFMSPYLEEILLIGKCSIEKQTWNFTWTFPHYIRLPIALCFSHCHIPISIASPFISTTAELFTLIVTLWSVFFLCNDLFLKKYVKLSIFRVMLMVKLTLFKNIKFI